MSTLSTPEVLAICWALSARGILPLEQVFIANLFQFNIDAAFVFATLVIIQFLESMHV